jgi:hypothetical protein
MIPIFVLDQNPFRNPDRFLLDHLHSKRNLLQPPCRRTLLATQFGTLLGTLTFFFNPAYAPH